MKIAVVGILHETNTFAPGLTQYEDFNIDVETVSGNEIFMERYHKTRTSMGGVIDAVKERGSELAAGSYFSTTPSGMVSADAAERLISEMVDSIDESADGVVAILHGAMVAEGIPDMEGEILHRMREKIGDSMPIALTLDLHANVSQRMVDLADVIVGYDTYPHIDMYERAVEAVEILHRIIRNEVKPVIALARPNMLIVPQMMVTDEPGLMKEIVERAKQIQHEDPDILNVTVIGGFPYSDMPDAGYAFIVTADQNIEKAQRYADELKQMTWDNREKLLHKGLSPQEAVALAMSKEDEQGPVILVEGSDNVGGGAPADATHTLAHLVNPVKKSLVVICDPEAAVKAHELGVGAQFTGKIGGKSDDLHGDPVAIEGKIRLLFDGFYKHIGAYMTGSRHNMGRTAVIEAGNLTVIITEKRTAPWDPGHVSSVGLRPEDFHVIVVKSAIAWKTAFGHVAKEVIHVDSPGCCASNLEHFDYKLLKRPIYPLDSV